MEDFLTSFFITPFTGLAEGIASATSPLDVIDAVDGFVWGPIMILLLLGTHIFMTIRTGFIQRKIGTGIKLSVTKDDPSNADGDITQFGALTTALAATIGTGNIVGVGTGLLFGGPGAIFWMWITGILGIATKYSEVFIGVKYRVKDHSGKMLGGAMYALERGFKNKKAGRILAILFALFASLAAFGIGASTQSNSLADALYNTSLIDGKAIPQWLVGAVVVMLVAIVILGGIKSISKVCEKLVPVMAIFYVVCCLAIIAMNGQYLGEAIRAVAVGFMVVTGLAYFDCLGLVAWRGAATLPVFILGDVALGAGLCAVLAKADDWAAGLLAPATVAAQVAWGVAIGAYGLYLVRSGLDATGLLAAAFVLGPVCASGVAAAARCGKLAGKTAAVAVLVLAFASVAVARYAFFAMGVGA